MFLSKFLGISLTCLKGNHEDAMLRFLEDIGIGPSWLGFGGEATLMSYGIDLYARPAPQQNWLKTIQTEFQERLPDDHRRFFESLVLLGDFWSQGDDGG